MTGNQQTEFQNQPNPEKKARKFRPESSDGSCLPGADKGSNVAALHKAKAS